jgi:hypothetical protein
MARTCIANNGLLMYNPPNLTPAGTLIVRFKPTWSAIGSQSRIIATHQKTSGGTPTNLLDLAGSYNHLYAGLYLAGTDYRIDTTSTPFSAGVWATWIITWNDAANVTELYHDNTLVASKTTPVFTTASETFDSLIVGCRIAGTDYVDGDIAELARWDRVVTAGERATLQTSSPLFVQSGLVFYFPLFGDASPEPDQLGGAGLTLNGSPAKAAHPIKDWLVSPGFLPSTAVVFSPTITAEAIGADVTVEPAFIASTATVFNPTVSYEGFGPIGETHYPAAIDQHRNLLIAANNKAATLATDITSAALEMTVNEDISLWPSSGALTLDVRTSATLESSEICYYEGIGGQSLFISQRGIDGTSAKPFFAGDRVELREIARHHNVIADAIIAIETEVDTKSVVGHAHAIASITGLDEALASKLDLTGGALTGALTLAGAPTAPEHATTKAYVDSMQAAVWNVRNYGLTGGGTTDDTTAFQSLLNTVASAGGGRIFFPRGVYKIAGALQDTSGSNAQIVIPLRSDSLSPITIELIGEVTPSTWFWEQAKPNGSSYSIIQSTLTGASGNASLIGGKKPAESGLANGVTVNFKDLIFELPPNPSITAIDLENQQGNRMDHVLIYDGTITESHNQPTYSNSVGVKLPPTNHSSRIDLDSLHIIGLYAGVRLGELTHGTIICQGCFYAIEVPFAYHPSKLSILGVYGCPNNVVVTGANARSLRIDLLSIQDDTGYGQPWQNKVVDIYDPSNLLHGSFSWYNVKAGVGVQHSLIKNGGTNFIGTELW